MDKDLVHTMVVCLKIPCVQCGYYTSISYYFDTTQPTGPSAINADTLYLSSFRSTNNLMQPQSLDWIRQ